MKVRIMLVEDEPPIARALKRMLESLSGEYVVVTTAFNGEAALQLLGQHKIDVLFTDIRMPVMDGLELMKQLSRNYPDVRVVVLSGYDEFEYARQALVSHAFDYLLKPIDADILRDVMERICAELLEEQELELPMQDKAFDMPVEQGEDVLDKIEQFLKSHYTEDITNEMLSKEFGFVPSYISRIFRRSRGVSPVEYITRLRITRAKEIMLQRPATMIKEVSAMVGYKNQYHFSKVFKKEAGVWPIQYREGLDE